MGEKKTKLMLYSILVEIEVEVAVELGNTQNKTPCSSVAASAKQNWTGIALVFKTTNQETCQVYQ